VSGAKWLIVLLVWLVAIVVLVEVALWATR